MSARLRRRASGFTLIEVLVGVAIGIIGVLVMFQMVALFDAQARSTTSGSDAQVSGTMAMFGIERDVKQAGMGFGKADQTVMGCNVTLNDTLNLPARNFPLYPVNIVAGAAGAPDEIDILYGNSSFYVESQPFSFSTPTTQTPKRRGGFRNGDLAVIAGNATGLPSSATCDLVEVTNDALPDGVSLEHATTTYPSFYATNPVTPRYNTAGGLAGYTSGFLYNLGPTPQRNLWKVSAGNLTLTEDLHTTPAINVANRVVNLKAEYGIDTNADFKPDVWTNVPPADWTTVLAIRVALLVRSQHFEKSADPNATTPVGVTPVAPSWAGGAFVMTNVDGTADSFDNTQADPNNWRFYRYRVYERAIPLRNIIWGTAPSCTGC